MAAEPNANGGIGPLESDLMRRTKETGSIAWGCALLGPLAQQVFQIRNNSPCILLQTLEYILVGTKAKINGLRIKYYFLSNFFFVKGFIEFEVENI